MFEEKERWKHICSVNRVNGNHIIAKHHAVSETEKILFHKIDDKDNKNIKNSYLISVA